MKCGLVTLNMDVPDCTQGLAGWREGGCEVVGGNIQKEMKPIRFLCPWDFPGKNIGVGCHFLLQEIFPTQGSNPGLSSCRQMLYRLNHQGSQKEMKGAVNWSKDEREGLKNIYVCVWGAGVCVCMCVCVCVYMYAHTLAHSLSHVQLCNLMDCSLPGSSVLKVN